MNEEFKKGINNLKKISMTRLEKDLLLERVLQTGSAPTSFWVSPVFYSYSFAVLLLVFVVGGTASLSAEKSVPGDLLYPLKTNINEPLRTAITLDGASKIEWQSEKIERRLTEAEILSNRGEINEKSSAIIEKNIEKNLEDLDKMVEKITEKKPAQPEKTSEVQFKLKVKSDAHETIINKISEKKEEKEKEKIKSLNNSLKKKINKKIEDLENRKKKD